MRSLAIFLCLAVTAFAGEYAVLANGARLHADRHEAEAGKVRLYKGAGFIELDAAQVHSFDVEEALPAPSSVPQPAALAEPTPAGKPELSIPALADAAADKYGLPRKLVRSVIAAESAF